MRDFSKAAKYNIFYIIVGLDTIRNLKRKAFLNEVMGIDVRNTVILIKDKLSTFVFRIIVCLFIIIVLKYLSLS